MPIQITARREGFRRCGIAHSAKATTYEDGHFTPKQLAELENDPQLVVVRITAGAATDAQGLDKQLTLAGETITRQEQDVVYLVNKEGEFRYPVAGKVGFPFFGELILDCLNRTENAMTQAHAFKAAELCVKAQMLANAAD